jgi:hypothetical protein
VNADDKDDIFSLVEVHRGEPEVPPLRPPTNWSLVPNAKGAKYNKNAEGDKKADKPDKPDRKNKKNKKDKGSTEE